MGDPAIEAFTASAGRAADPLPGVSVVVPCFNSVATLGELVSGLAEVLPRCAERFEVILVNDHSQDGTWNAIGELARRHAFVRGIDLMRNYGQQSATLCGTRAARYDVTVTMDDDLQHPPAEVVKLLRKLESGYDVVYGTPERMRHSMFRNLTSWLAKYAVSLAARQRIVRDINAFRAFRTGLRNAFWDHKGPEIVFDVLLLWGTTQIVAERVAYRERASGRSGYGLRSLLHSALHMWIGYTTAPLRLASWIGFAFVIFGVGVLVRVLHLYFTEGSVPGFVFLSSTIAIFGGVQLFALGIIGEYLARIFERSMERPAYLVKQVVGGDGASGSR